MKKTEVKDWREFYEDTVEFVLGVGEVNPQLYTQIKHVIDAPPHMVCMLGAYVPINKWATTSQRGLLEASGITYHQMQWIKKSLNETTI